MGSRSALAFGRLVGVTGLGAYLGAAVAGVVAVVTGQAFGTDGMWLAGLPVLAVLGGGVGAAIALVTRRWLLPNARRRWLLFVGLGIIVLPLAVAVGQLRSVAAVGLPFVLAGAIAMLVVYHRAGRRAAGRGQRQRPTAATR